MPNCHKLLERARRAPANLRFTEVRSLATCFGWKYVRTSGDHVMHKRDKTPTAYALMNFQNVGGKAKPYQVQQLLDAIEALDLRIDEQTLTGEDRGERRDEPAA
jgi:hypothetical protein